MENASKALIIAGAILLAILLISLGIMVFTQAQGTVENSGMSQAEITTFNSKFIKYEGKKVKGAVVKTMINEVIANNADENLPNVTINSNDPSGSPIMNSSSGTAGIILSKTYEVKLEYTGGERVSNIVLTQNN